MLIIKYLIPEFKRDREAFNKYYTKMDNCPLYAAALILYLNCYIKYIYIN